MKKANYIQELETVERHGKNLHNSLLVAKGVACIVGSPLAGAVGGIIGFFAGAGYGLKKEGFCAALVVGPVSGVCGAGIGLFGSLGLGAKGFIDVATQNPLTSNEQKKFFKDLAYIQNNNKEDWKKKMIDAILNEYKPSWLQSSASSKLIEALENKEKSVDFKFNKINKYVLDNTLQFSANNGRKLFCTIQKVVTDQLNKETKEMLTAYKQKQFSLRG